MIYKCLISLDICSDQFGVSLPLKSAETPSFFFLSISRPGSNFGCGTLRGYYITTLPSDPKKKHHSTSPSNYKYRITSTNKTLVKLVVFFFFLSFVSSWSCSIGLEHVNHISHQKSPNSLFGQHRNAQIVRQTKPPATKPAHSQPKQPAHGLLDLTKPKRSPR